MSISAIIPVIAFIVDDGDLPYFVPTAFKDLLTMFENKYMLIIAFIGLYFFKQLFVISNYMFQAKVVYGIKQTLILRLFDSYISDQNFDADLVSKQLKNLTTEAQQLVNNILLPFVLLVGELFVVLVALCVLLFIDFQILLIVTLLVAPLFLLFNILTKTKMQTLGKERHTEEEQVVEGFIEGLTGKKEIHIYNIIIRTLDRVSSSIVKVVNIEALQLTISQSPRIFLEFAFILVIFVQIMLYSASGVPLTEKVPQLALFVVLALRTMPSLNRILHAMQALHYAAPIIQLYTKSACPPALIGAVSSESVKIHPEFTVKFLPDSGVNVSSNLSMVTLLGGQIYIIQGRSGSGKTTLIEELIGLNQKNRRTELRGAEEVISHIPSRHVAYAPQQPFIFKDTLRENVLIGTRNDNYENVINRLKLNKIEKLPQLSLNTISGGEKQRISIARAVLSDRKYIFLDEPTSALDYANVSFVKELFRDERRNGKCLVIVSHDKDIIELADVIIDVQ